MTPEFEAALDGQVRAHDLPLIETMLRSPSNVAQCMMCGRTGKLFVCAGCDGQSYCSAICQAKEWPTHQKVCTITRSTVLANRLRRLRDPKALAKKLAAIAGRTSTCDLKTTGKLIRMGLQLGCDDSNFARLALNALNVAQDPDDHGNVYTTAHAPDAAVFVKYVVTDLVACGLQLLEDFDICYSIFQIIITFSMDKREIGFDNEARRAGVLRFCAESMHHYRRVFESNPLQKKHPATIHMVAYMFISMSFCNQGAKKHYFHHMYQARVAGLSECFVYAARNGLIGQFKGIDMAPVVESWARSIRKANKPRDAVDEEGYRFSASLIRK